MLSFDAFYLWRRGNFNPVRISMFVIFPVFIASSNSVVAAKTSSLPSPCVKESGDINRTTHASNIIIIIDAAQNSVNIQFFEMQSILTLEKASLTTCEEESSIIFQTLCETHFYQSQLISQWLILPVSQKVSFGLIQFIIITTDVIISFQ